MSRPAETALDFVGNQQRTGAALVMPLERCELCPLRGGLPVAPHAATQPALDAIPAIRQDAAIRPFAIDGTAQRGGPLRLELGGLEGLRPHARDHLAGLAVGRVGARRPGAATLAFVSSMFCSTK